MLDLRISNVEVEINPSGNILRVNTSEGCVLRIQGINFLRVVDNRYLVRTPKRFLLQRRRKLIGVERCGSAR